MDITLIHLIRALSLAPGDEERLRELVENYGRNCHRDGYTAGYNEGMRVANSDRP